MKEPGVKEVADEGKDTAFQSWGNSGWGKPFQHLLISLHWDEKVTSEWVLQVAELINSNSQHPWTSGAGIRESELVYWRIPNLRHYLDSNWNCCWKIQVGKGLGKWGGRTFSSSSGTKWFSPFFPLSSHPLFCLFYAPILPLFFLPFIYLSVSFHFCHHCSISTLFLCLFICDLFVLKGTSLLLEGFPLFPENPI